MSYVLERFETIKAELKIPVSLGGLRPVFTVLKILLAEHESLGSILQISDVEIDSLLAELNSGHHMEKLDSTKFEQGWCENYPVYALLLESAQSLPRLPMSIWSVVGVVLEFCLTHKARFNNHPQRLEELCRSLRRLMVMVTPCHLIDNRIYKNTAEVAAAMSRLSEHKEIAKADRKYAMYIATTLQDEWKRVLRTSGPTRSGPRGGKRSRPVAGSTQATDHPGISLVDTSVFGLQDDVLSLAEHVSDCVAIEVQLDAAEFQNRSCLDVIQDQLVSKVHSINITRRLQQSNNKNLLSTSLFQSDEIEALLTALFTKAHKDNHDCNGKLLISLMLWTGLPAEVLFTWQYNSTGPGLIVRDGRWFTQIFLAPLLTNAKPQKVVLTCPEQIAHFAKLLSAERTDQQLFTTKGLKSLDGAARQWLARISRRSGCELFI